MKSDRTKGPAFGAAPMALPMISQTAPAFPWWRGLYIRESYDRSTRAFAGKSNVELRVPMSTRVQSRSRSQRGR
jgi:hypothetical protein